MKSEPEIRKKLNETMQEIKKDNNWINPMIALAAEIETLKWVLGEVYE